MLALTLAMIAQDIEEPHRPAIERLALSMPKDEAVTCVSRALSAHGIVNTMPVADGVEIDFNMKPGLFAAPGDPLMTVSIKTDAAGLFMTVLYRHPFGAKGVVNNMRGVAKKCFVEDWNRWAASSGAKPID